MTTAAPVAPPTILELEADTLTPVSAALRLGDRLAFILESVEGGTRYGRYSFVGVRGARLEVPRGTDPLEALRRVLPPAPAASPEVPFPLAAGIGYLSYEVAALWDRVPVPSVDPIGLPDAVFHIPAAVIVFDHLEQAARIAAPAGPGAGEVLESIAATLEMPAEGEVPRARRRRQAAGEGPVDDDAGYRSAVARTVHDIRAGEMLQAVLARRFSVPTAMTPLAIYRSLRRINPSPYLFYVDLGAGSALVGASPELLVRSRDGVVVTRPIAGTRRRDPDPTVDAALEAELRDDPKELAEHAMLVDLARNDVGRVATSGSVDVVTYGDVERYSHVMHLVSEVRGRLRDELDAFDAVRATFPAGTVSGAPKVRAMAQIAELEGERRGPYGGAVGFFAPDDVEAAITIRSVVLRDGVAHVHAGAGIVADSEPAREAAEVRSKAAAMRAAISAGGAP